MLRKQTNMQALLLLLLSMLVTGTIRVNAISCYLCESAYESSCGEDFEMETFYKFDCGRVPPPRYLENELESLNATACMKKIYRENGVEKIIRSCFFGDVNDTDIGCRTDPSLTTDVQEVACHVCDNENYCNASRTPYACHRTSIFMLLLLLALFLFTTSRDMLPQS